MNRGGGGGGGGGGATCYIAARELYSMNYAVLVPIIWPFER